MQHEESQTGFAAAASWIAGTAVYAGVVYAIGYVVIGAIEYAVTGNVTGQTATAASALAVIVIITN